jgi:hypothetical protein
MRMHSFKFRLGQRVTILPGGKTALIVGRAQYADYQDHFLVSYRDSRGGLLQVWWAQNSLECERTRLCRARGARMKRNGLQAAERATDKTEVKG